MKKVKWPAHKPKKERVAKRWLRRFCDHFDRRTFVRAVGRADRWILEARDWRLVPVRLPNKCQRWEFQRISFEEQFVAWTKFLPEEAQELLSPEWKEAAGISLDIRTLHQRKADGSIVE